MKKKKIGIRFLILLMLVSIFGCLFSACGRKGEENSDYYLYYLNQEKTKLVRAVYAPAAEDTEGLIAEFCEKLSEQTYRVEEQKLFPENVELERYEYQDHQLYLYFNKAYGEISPAEEVLCRGGVVHTMMQIPEVSGVSFYVDNLPIIDAMGEEVGIMTEETFVENPGEKINNIQEVDLTLYFATEDGEGLVAETQHVYYSSNFSTEKLVMEQLLQGPKSENAKASIPAGTTLISVSVMDGVCFVNLNEGFLVQDFTINEDVVIYAIVNSLTELPTINTVQLSVNGETNLNYRDKMSLTEYYKRNLDLVIEEGEKVEVIQKEEKEGLIESGK